MKSIEDKPLIIITEPEIQHTQKESFNDGLVCIDIYDYDNSHIIYKNIDLGSFKELVKRNQEMNDLREAAEENYKYIQYLHSVFEDKVIGKKGKCSCGLKGEYCYDPYEKEINETEVITCLCPICYQERVEDI